MRNFATFTTLRPHSLLRHLSSCGETTCLQAFSNLVTWSIYLKQGRITYATHSVEPFDRLERHLHRLSYEIPGLTSEVRLQLRLIFTPDLHHQLSKDNTDSNHHPNDYRAIHWLINQGYLNHQQATLLIQELVQEVIESFLLIKTGSFALSDSGVEVSDLCRLDVKKIVECCQIKLHNWLSLAPHISSPYQRPYLFNANIFHNSSFRDIQPNLTNWSKGLSLRHLAAMINQDEIQLSKTLHSDIVKGRVILHEPDPPFDQLPRNVDIWGQTSKNIIPLYKEFSDTHPVLTKSNNINYASEKVTNDAINTTKIYKIVSVDDSPTILKQISFFLQDETFIFVPINDPLKSVMSIIRHKPDLILLDLNMAGIDGYELCRIIKNNPSFKKTPVIFVTACQGIIDKVKARLVGGCGYLTKPFTRVDLLKIIFQHLN
ncbi:response regulator [Chrysosporum bergii ANA360D]|uniref:Protein PatA n=1 Tax=Chrysosporum bergii ANA360D TaxID=617107 RepID=A0AA43GU43_9CYAN|nr:response regulator [Chrysosporum bergii]MDH6061624.1 response regulator [Chrysosporum bergii ANA360D]